MWYSSNHHDSLICNRRRRFSYNWGKGEGEMSQQDNRGSITKLFDRMTLSWRLMADGRVSLMHKLIPPLALLYVLSPIDFVPEILLGPFGVVDDIGLAILALEFFIRTAPSEVVREHLADLQRRYYSDKRKNTSEDDIVEGQYRYRE
ncbi:MAG: DUF1232 domain-containing protein [Anaerolineae bacterium]|nr:MAG: DUF1232 domain-containing protein [Anaerolineae bacterium]